MIFKWFIKQCIKIISSYVRVFGGGGGEGRGVSLLYQMTDLHISWHTGLIGDYLATLLDTLYAIRKCKKCKCVNSYN